MKRHELTDPQWELLTPFFPPRPRRRGGQWRDDRTILNGIFWRLNTGAPWRDLPERYGPYTTVYNRFNRWSKQGVWEDVFYALSGSSGVVSTTAVDATHVKAHRSAAGAKGGTSSKRSADRAADGRPKFTP